MWSFIPKENFSQLSVGMDQKIIYPAINDERNSIFMDFICKSNYRIRVESWCMVVDTSEHLFLAFLSEIPEFIRYDPHIRVDIHDPTHSACRHK